MKRRALFSLVLAIFANSAFAFVAGGSNLQSWGYPEQSCRKPTKPIKPYSFNSKWEIDSYNQQVDMYNDDFQRYIKCVKEYLENANNDIKRIQERMDEAVAEAKRPSY